MRSKASRSPGIFASGSSLLWFPLSAADRDASPRLTMPFGLRTRLAPSTGTPSLAEVAHDDRRNHAGKYRSQTLHVGRGAALSIGVRANGCESKYDINSRVDYSEQLL